MPGPGTKWAKYGKKYNKDWEKESGLKEWIQPVVGDDSKALCRVRKCEIRAHHADLKQHASTEKHKKNAAPFSTMRLTDSGFTVSRQNESRQRAELKVATYVSCHTSIKSVDHLGELMFAPGFMLPSNGTCEIIKSCHEFLYRKGLALKW